MNQDLQQLTPFDGFNEPVEYGGGSVEQDRPKVGIVTKLHRALRGRYIFALPLALIFGTVGGYFGFRSQKAIYKCEGLIRVKLRIETAMVNGQIPTTSEIPMYEEFMQAQVQKIMGRTLLYRALELVNQDRKSPWVMKGRGSDWTALQEFAANLSADHPLRTQVIHVTYTDPDSGVAAAAVKAMIATYQSMYENNDDRQVASDLKRLTDHANELEDSIRVAREHIDGIAKDMGTGSSDFGAYYAAKLTRVTLLESRVGDAKLKYERLKKDLTAEEYFNSLTDYQIAMEDSTMAQKIATRDNLEMSLQRYANETNNPTYLSLKPQLDTINAQIKSWGNDFRKKNIEKSRSGDPSGRQDPKVCEDEMDQLTAMLQTEKAAMRALGEKEMDVKRFNQQITEWESEKTEYDKEIALFMVANNGPGRLEIISHGDPPMAPFKDPRKKMGAAAALGGAMIPMGLFLALGLMDKRYRYSDQAESGVGSPPLLGILPTLPDKLSDPEQAAIAAHCIHQIRIMLQVSAQQDQKRVFMITSASTGDGKTSLTMALGLSFAASGARTLVIDCDMVGQGLTHRLKARQSPGLLEALASNTLQGRVKKTTTPNLYILPIGGADSAHAGTLAPHSIKRLLTEARKIFDTVLIDTGPILGSLEASVVAAAADSVIIAIARGQQQPLVDRSIRQLRAIGASIAGLVFNRAEKRDFHRSVGSTSMRSVSALPAGPRPMVADGDEPSRFGPLARAVASFTPGPAASSHSAKALEHLSSKGNGQSGHSNATATVVTLSSVLSTSGPGAPDEPSDHEAEVTGARK